MLPAVIRNDPCLSARPDLRRGMEDWWAGSLWDPRTADGDNFSTDFTCESSMEGVLSALHSHNEVYEPLLSAVAAGDLALAEHLLASGANATHALHLALQENAAPEAVHLLAVWSDDLNVWLPEPVVVAWARSLCDLLVSNQPVAVQRRAGAMERLDALLRAGADVNAVGRGCETALHVIAQQLRSVCEDSTGSSRVKLQRSEQDEAEQKLCRAWHGLVARGADAGMLDGDGLTAVERLSINQCGDLLAAKRNAYGYKRYSRARLRGEDPSLSWLGSEALQSQSSVHSPVPPIISGSRHSSRPSSVRTR